MGENFGDTFRLAEINKRFNVSRKFSFEYSLQFLNYPSIGGGRENQKEFMYHLFKATHNFNQNLYLKGYIQYSSMVKKTNVQFFVFYRFLPPAGMVQFGIQKGSPYRGIIEDGPTTFFIKCSYAF